jgi:hypothetical protein
MAANSILRGSGARDRRHLVHRMSWRGRRGSTEASAGVERRAVQEGSQVVRYDSLDRRITIGQRRIRDGLRRRFDLRPVECWLGLPHKMHATHLRPSSASAEQGGSAGSIHAKHERSDGRTTPRPPTSNHRLSAKLCEKDPKLTPCRSCPARGRDTHSWFLPSNTFASSALRTDAAMRSDRIPRPGAN